MTKRLLIILWASLVSAQALVAQNKFSATTGFGFPELLHAGVRYEFGQYQLGGTLGMSPISDDKHENMQSVSASFYYHFGGFSELSELKPWYVKTGSSYFWGETTDEVYKNVLADLRAGRQFNITENLGIELNLGITLLLYEDVERASPPFLDKQDWSMFPATGIGLYYRF